MTAQLNDRRRRFPLGYEVKLSELSIDPYPILGRLRESEPVSWVPEVGMWFVTRRDDVLQVLGDVDTYSVESDKSIIRDIFGAHMMTTDGREQIRYKRHCISPFRVRALEEVMRPAVMAKVRTLVDDVRRQGAAEFRLAVAKPLAIYSVMTVLGLPEAQAERVHHWYDSFAQALANFAGDEQIRERAKSAASEFGDLVRWVLPDAPEGSLLRSLAAEDDRLTDEEIVANAMIIMFGGIETTESMICNTIWALLKHPQQLARVRRNPALIGPVIQEALRWEPSVQSCTRHLTRDVELRGVRLVAGEIVQCMIGGANRDPTHFENPDEFDITRHNAGDHVSFGAGRHYCLGAPLAVLETEIVLQQVLIETPQLDFDPHRPSAPRGYEFRKPPELWVLTGRRV